MLDIAALAGDSNFSHTQNPLEWGFMKSKRVVVPKSVRFEVFKRDSFTCKYCGAKAPEAVLHVDHNAKKGGS